LGGFELRFLEMRGINGPKIQAYMCYYVKCCRSEINGIRRNRKKSPKLGSAPIGPAAEISDKICPHPPCSLFNVQCVGLSLRIGHRCSGHKKLTRMMGLRGRGRSLMISSVVWIQYTKVSDEQTNGQTPDNIKDCAYS